jgi:class 3 adenylate cyclase/tetratricopeptide (TPR) repeat protein
LAGAPAPAAAAPDAERKQVTVLFSDLVGFTALSERLDPEETRQIMGRVFARAAEIVGSFDGRIEKFIGDAIMAIFGVPSAHEDDPVRAVRAAQQLHEAVAELSAELEKRIGGPLALHSGVNTGLVVTGELQFDRGTAGPVGDTINLAARLMDAAGKDEIFVGPETARLVARAFDLEDLGPRPFKGKAEPVPVARVRGARQQTPSARFRGKFVGRQEELGVLLGAAERLRDGQPSAITIRGEAGTGKTRLLEEFRARLGNDVQWLEGRAYPYAQNIPYFPLIDLLSRSWGIQEDDTPQGVLAKIQSGVAALLGAQSDVLPVIARLYGIEVAGAPLIDREAFQGLLLGAMQRLMTTLAGRAPTVICLQDLHWADASTVTLLRSMLGGLRAPALLLGNYRPGYQPSGAARVLDLGELSPRQTGELLQSLLDDQPPPAELQRFVEQRSDGNPFFVEEIVNSLVETHVLERVDGSWRLTRPLTDAVLPTTIRGVIAARIDRLDERRKRVLRDAAVVGREFLYEVVARVTREAEDLEPSLEQLEAADLIHARSRDPDVEYVFKHALTQEVAYDGLLKSERAVLHERAATAMEQILRERIPEFVETLAYHFLRGGVVDKAVHYLRASGRKCVERYAIAAAAAHYESAYELLTGRERTAAQDRALVELLCEWSLVHYYLGDCGPWRTRLEAHLELAERVGDPELLAMYLGWTGHMLFWHLELEASMAALDRAARLAEEAGSKRVLAYAETWRAWTLSMLGRTGDAIRAGERGVELGRQFADEPYLHFKPLAGIAQATVFSGDLERTRLAGEELLEIAARTGNSRGAVLGHYVLSLRHSNALEPERGIESARAALAAATDPAYRNFSTVALVVALGLASRPEEVARAVSDILPDTERLSQKVMIWLFRAAQATSRLALGEPSRGMRELEALRDERVGGWHQAFIEWSIALAHARIARREGKASLGVLLRNPGFVIRHVLPARRRARALLEENADHPPEGLRIVHGMANLELARLHAYLGEKDAARTRAARAIEIFEREGAHHAVAQARELRDSL